MSIGGIAVLLLITLYHFSYLTTIGTVLYILDRVFFVLLCAGMMIRFTLSPSALKHSLLHSSEPLLFPTCWISMPTILGCMQDYGVPPSGPWLIVALRVLLLLFVACTYRISVVQYFFLFTAKELTVHSMTPARLCLSSLSCRPVRWLMQSPEINRRANGCQSSLRASHFSL